MLWCVRSRRYLELLARSEELLTETVGGDIVAFIAESLPGQVMRGVPHAEWEAAGVDMAAVRRAADENTATRFARVLERVAAIERIPADGWRLAGNSLYQGSIVMVPPCCARWWSGPVATSSSACPIAAWRLSSPPRCPPRRRSVVVCSRSGAS